MDDFFFVPIIIFSIFACLIFCCFGVFAFCAYKNRYNRQPMFSSKHFKFYGFFCACGGSDNVVKKIVYIKNFEGSHFL